jgi:hypothetical protein
VCDCAVEVELPERIEREVDVPLVVRVAVVPDRILAMALAFWGPRSSPWIREPANV